MYRRNLFDGISATAVILFVVLGIMACSIGAYAVDTLINTQVTQPLRRQNIDSDADRRIQVEQQYRQLYNDFQSIQQRVPADKAAVARYKADNGADTTKYSYTQQQQFGQLEAILDGDYRAEIRLATDYNALATNADTGKFRPADLPPSLTPDSSQ